MKQRIVESGPKHQVVEYDLGPLMTWDHYLASRNRLLRTLREEIEHLPEPTLGKKGGVSRQAVLDLIDAGIDPTVEE